MCAREDEHKDSKIFTEIGGGDFIIFSSTIYVSRYHTLYYKKFVMLLTI